MCVNTAVQKVESEITTIEGNRSKMILANRKL
jgi:hypothetical protein